jgi:hypothetical protein
MITQCVTNIQSAYLSRFVVVCRPFGFIWVGIGLFCLSFG